MMEEYHGDTGELNEHDKEFEALLSKLSTCQDELYRVRGELREVRELYTDARRDRAYLREEVDELRELVRKVEWVLYEDGSFCPVCSWIKERGKGHAPDCEVAKALEKGGHGEV